MLSTEFSSSPEPPPIPAEFSDLRERHAPSGAAVTPAFYRAVGEQLVGYPTDSSVRLHVIAWALRQPATESLRVSVSALAGSYAHSGGLGFRDPVAPVIQYIRGRRSEVGDVLPRGTTPQEYEQVQGLLGQLAMLKGLYAVEASSADSQSID